MSLVTINIPAIIALFDEDKDVSKHTNAIKTMLGEPFMLGILLTYLQEKCIESEILVDKNNRIKPCVSGLSKGVRLDAWVRNHLTLFQVEVKFWSAHGVGSGAIFQKDHEEWEDYTHRLWNSFWNDDRGNFKEKSLQKVLCRMTPAAEDIGEREIKPLACLWSPIYDQRDKKPFFKVIPKEGDFDELWVFSVSTYLRMKANENHSLTINLPDYADRMQLLNLIAPIA